MTVADMSTRSGARHEDLLGAMRALPARGPCAAVAAAAATSAEVHRACPPGIVKASGLDAPGSAAWPARPPGRSTTPACKARRCDPPPPPRTLSPTPPAAPAAALGRWAMDADRGNLSAARHAMCPPAALAPLAARHRSAYESSDSATHPRCPPAVLDGLARRDQSWRIRAYAASNSACPQPTLDVVAEDGAYQVRAAVARNTACNAETFQRLVNDKSVTSRATSVTRARRGSGPPTSEPSAC